MFEESHFESALRWHVYRRWKRRPNTLRRAEYKLYRALHAVPKGALLIDCGANIGDVTVAALRFGMRSIAFEPDPKALAALRHRLGDEPAVTIIAKGVGASDRIVPFFQHPAATDGHVPSTQLSSFIQSSEHGDAPVTKVEIVDLVRFLRELDEPVALLKLDIEGAEVECLEALLDSGLYRQIGRIFVETHERIFPELAERTENIRRFVAANRIGNIDLDWG